MCSDAKKQKTPENPGFDVRFRTRWVLLKLLGGAALRTGACSEYGFGSSYPAQEWRACQLCWWRDGSYSTTLRSTGYEQAPGRHAAGGWQPAHHRQYGPDAGAGEHDARLPPVLGWPATSDAGHLSRHAACSGGGHYLAVSGAGGLLPAVQPAGGCNDGDSTGPCRRGAGTLDHAATVL